MKAARFPAYGAAELIQIDDVPELVAGPGQVLVDVVCASVNPVDVKMRAGSHRALVWWALPHGVGMDVSGIVQAVGVGVTRFAPGDRVWATPHYKMPGTFQERTIVPEAELGLMPKGLPFASAAGLPLVGLTALQSLDTAALGAGERILIHGASGAVGHVAVQIALAMGALVSGTASVRNHERLRSLGAVDCIDRTGDWMRHVPEADVVFLAAECDVDAVVRAAKPGARVVHILGDLPEMVEQYGPLFGALLSGVHLVSPTVIGAWRGVRCRHVLKRARGADMDRLAGFVNKGLQVWIDSEFPLEQAAQAHLRQEAGPSGKVIVRVRPDPQEVTSGDVGEAVV